MTARALRVARLGIAAASLCGCYALTGVRGSDWREFAPQDGEAQRLRIPDGQLQDRISRMTQGYSASGADVTAPLGGGRVELTLPKGRCYVFALRLDGAATFSELATAHGVDLVGGYSATVEREGSIGGLSSYASATTTERGSEVRGEVLGRGGVVDIGCQDNSTGRVFVGFGLHGCRGSCSDVGAGAVSIRTFARDMTAEQRERSAAFREDMQRSRASEQCPRCQQRYRECVIAGSGGMTAHEASVQCEVDFRRCSSTLERCDPP
jgi:hypothetical protein